MTGKPIITLKNFSGMGDNGIYWLDGFLPKSLQGQTILTQGWGNYSFISQSTSGFSSLEDIASMTSYAHIASNQVAALSIGGIIFDFNSYGFNKLGSIHQITTSGSLLPGQSGGIYSTRRGNLLYTSCNNVGVGWVSTATGGSTTTLIDTTRNFTSLGISSSTGANKLYNYSTGQLYTITSVSTTTNANDTLNFSAGTTITAGDFYVVFADAKFSFGTTNVSNISFNGQSQPVYWNRPISLWNDKYYFLNGNYISALSSDETTWTSDILEEYHKQLPLNHQALMFEFNQDRMLVASYINGKGALLLWDGYAAGWISNVELDSPVSGMIKYGSGWVVLIGASLYYTDGYSLQYLDKLPDSIYNNNIVSRKRNMISTEDGLILSFAGNLNSRLVSGNYAYSLKDKHWSYFPIQDKNGKFSQVAASLFVVNRGATTFFQGTPNIFCSALNEIGVILGGNAYKSNALIYVKLPQKMAINLVELNIAPRNDYNVVLNTTNNIKVNYGQGDNPMFLYTQASSGSNASLIKNGLGGTYRSIVGQELLITSGNTGGERTYISSIANTGTSNEELTISPALSASVGSTATYIKKFDLYSAPGVSSVNSSSFPQEIQFNIPSFYSDKLWLEIVFENQDQFPIDLHSINIY